ncbi:hypothetical protein J6590_024313 [Homalodisca vitripennis]|nr:hypothetical protein J6590_024313 [Homalodisca vitripennis]
MFVPNPSQTPTDADPPKPELQVIEIKNTEEPSPRKPMIKMEECYMEISSSEDEEEGNNAAATLELCLQEEDRLLTLNDLEEIIDEVATGEPKHQPSNIQEELGTDWDVLSIHDSESLDLKEAEDQINPQHRASVIQLGKPIEVLGGHTASSDRPTVIQQTSLDAREVTFSGEAGRLDEDRMTITVSNSTQPRDPSSTEKKTKKRQRDRKQRTRKVKRLGKGTRKSGGHPHPTTSVTNDIGGSTRPSDVPRAQHAPAGMPVAQHAPAGMPVAQHAPPTRYRWLNTPVRRPAGSARPCGGVGGSTRLSDEVPGAQHAHAGLSGAQHARPVSRGLNTPMRGCRGLNTPVRRGTGGSTRPSGVPRAQHAHAGVSGAQHARPTRYRGLNTPVRCPAGSTRPCGGVGGSTRPSDWSGR